MNPYGSPDPPRTLTERLTRLNENLRTLGERLKSFIAGVVGEAIADAVRDSVRHLLGGEEALADPYRDQREVYPRGHSRDDSYDRVNDPWDEEDRRWAEDEAESYSPAREKPVPRTNTRRRWRSAVSAAVQTCLWFLKGQPRRRPVLTTLVVTLVAGITGFVAGPVLAAGAGVLASVAGLLLTADASKSVAELATG
jgi:hypothetical protein